ncbi:MAG TPA: NADH-quinone oxidoreductase subunit G [Actinomycetota bacterium]
MSVTLTIDGRTVTVPEGTLIIRAAESIGIEVPRFCDHPYLDPVGACRTCLVEVEGQAKLVTSCTTPVVPDMVVRTQNTSEGAAKGQRGQLEFLLINHPLDCPVCDRGGECPLQDQTLAFGPAESRYIDPKRVYEKPIELSPQVLLDRERCVLCARCTRFCDEISGERFIELFERGAAEQVSISPGEDFASPFSGNTVQICPVGALTNASYRFAARPFDVKRGDSICPHCACGCGIRVDTRRGEVVRHLARDVPEVNEAWLCDKGRNAFRFPDRDRLETPMLRVPGLEPASHAEVFAEIAARARGGRAAFLGGARLTDEDAYAMAKLARVAFRTNDLDHRMGVGTGSWDLERLQAAPGTPVTYADVERAAAILVVGLDTREELPILHLRIRKAHRKGGAKVFVVHPRRTALDVAEHVLCPPGGEAAALAELRSGSDEIANALREAGEGVVVLAGPRLAESPEALEQAASLAADVGGRIAYLTRRAGDRGALRAGVHPALLPGGRRLDDPAERAEVEAVWGGSLPAEPGRSTREILEAAAAREIDLLFLVGVDPLTDFPDLQLVRRALANAGFTVIVDISLGEYEPYADAVIPAAAFLEKAGHLTDWEGRGQRMAPVRDPIGLSRPEWRMFQELSEVLGADLGFGSLEDVQAELGDLLAPREVPAPAPVPALPRDREGEGLSLFTYPLLVDGGRLSVDADELKAALHREPFLEVHPADADSLGLQDGGRVRIRTERGEAELPVVVTDGIHEGAVFVPYNQEGLRMSELLAGSTITAVELEAVEAPAEALEGAG